MPLPTWTRYRPGKTFWVLLVATAAGLLAAVSAQRYLSEQVEHIEARHRSPTVSIVVAKTDLPAGARLSNQTAAVRPVPQDHAHSAAVRPEQFDRIEGQRLQHPLKAGDAVLWSSLEAPRPATFSARVALGRRAVTIPVDDINAIAGLLEPGDLIDLLLVLDSRGRKQTVTLLSAVQVLATGQRPVDGPPAPGERRLYTTVTLDVDPQQARNLVLAREVGRLTALLRRAGEAPAHPLAPVDLADWLAAQQPPVPAPAPSTPDVPVLYGGAHKPAPTPALPPVQVQWAPGAHPPTTEAR
jgi:pilus assembly protein CpaB